VARTLTVKRRINHIIEANLGLLVGGVGGAVVQAIASANFGSGQRVGRGGRGKNLEPVFLAHPPQRGEDHPVNPMIVKAMAMEAWTAFHSRDVDDGARNSLGALIFDGMDGSRNTRAAMARKVQIPLRGVTTFAMHAAQIWSASPALHIAETRSAARQAASDLARSLGLLEAAAEALGLKSPNGAQVMDLVVTADRKKMMFPP
jgi:hypothetical protein